MADFADRSLGIGYAGGSSILLALLLTSLLVWRWREGTVSVNTVATPRVEAFYWTTILFSQTLGTALGDWMADTNGLGFENAALVFGAALLVLAAAYYFTNVSRVLLFWAAFILTRPLGATLGDLLDKPIAHGGFAFSRTDGDRNSRRRDGRTDPRHPATSRGSTRARLPRQGRRNERSRAWRKGAFPRC